VPRRLLTVLSGALLAVPALAMTGTAATAAPAAPAKATASPSKIPSLVRAEAARIGQAMTRSKSSRLSPQQARTIGADFLPVRTDGALELDLHATGPVGAAQADQLRALGATVLDSSADFAKVPDAALPDVGLIHAAVPYNRVDAVAGLSWVAAIRPTIRPAVDAGPMTSEGVALHNVPAAAAHGLTGAGQKVGVISDGTTSIAQSVALGELPSSVQVIDPGEGDEGTAMLEIIHDMAPGAALAFNTVGADLAGYVTAFRNLAAAGSTMIAEDLAFDDEPAFQQGLGATTAEQLAKSGIWVSSSAGNLGAKHAPRSLAIGTGGTPDGVTSSFSTCSVAPNNVVRLRGTDTTYDITIANNGAILPTLQWSEPRAIFPTVGQGGFTDLNLYLMSADGTQCLAESSAVQANGVGDTIEQLLYENTTGAAVRAKLVVSVAGTSSAAAIPTLDLRWRTAGVTTNDTPDRAGSLNPDSNYLGAATSAGAVAADLSTDPAVTPLETFSAAGPVQIGVTTRCAGGAAGPCVGRKGSGFTSFPAPNWAAADGVSVSGVGGFGSGVCPAVQQGGCLFFGTSAAAPSAAGVAALVRQQYGAHLPPRQLNSIMYDLALPRNGVAFGHGVLRALR
jgi:subtilase family protein